MTKFVYSVLRFMPSLASGEFVNIGVIVGCEALDAWGYRIVKPLTRMNTIAQIYGIDPSVAMRFVQKLTTFIDDADKSVDKPSEQWLIRLSEDAHMIWVTRPLAVLAKDLEEALTKVFDTIFSEQAEASRQTPTPLIPINLRKSYRDNKARAVEAFERRFVTELMRESQGNITAAARLVRMDRKYLSEMIRRHGLKPTP